MRSMMFVGLLLCGSIAHAGEPTALSGSWSLTGKFSGGIACDKEKAPQVIAYQWIVTVQPSGKVAISVQGDTAFQNLSGKTDGTRMEVSATTNNGYQKALSHFELNFAGDSLSGTRTHIGSELTHCTWSITGKRL